MEKLYKDYFTVDENYFPAVNEELINQQGKTLWQSFYPHETFIQLLEDIEGVLSRRKKLSIWTEGEYGTGKSHAVLTAKKILDSSKEETKEYFDKYKNVFPGDLYSKIQGSKEQGKILTIYKNGSSSITDDGKLIAGIQESIIKELAKEGIKAVGLKESAIKWLEDEVNKEYFNKLVEDKYFHLFEGDNADTVINKLKKLDDGDLESLISKIGELGESIELNLFKMDINKLIKWIDEEVIKKNNFKSVIFIWDEFTEYFKNNSRSLSGFQKIVEMSATIPFHMLVVTHLSKALFDNTNSEAKKINDRFINPKCKIELPQAMAFKLIGSAMKVSENSVIKKQWECDRRDIYEELQQSKDKIKEYTKAKEDEIEEALPIHPYSILILKELASAYESNQRSMFDFIKSTSDDKVESFQWFINNFSSESSWNILTIDMLWSFFATKGKNKEDSKISEYFNFYKNKEDELNNESEKRVLKTILLLQAISETSRNDVKMFLPNEENLNLAFEGTEFSVNEAVQIANDDLVKNEIIYIKKDRKGINMYSSVGTQTNDNEIKDDIIKIIETKKCQDYVYVINKEEFLELPDEIKQRMTVEYVTVDNITRTVNELKIKRNEKEEQIKIIMCFAKDEEERNVMEIKINECLTTNSNYIFVDATEVPLGERRIRQYAEALANQKHHSNKDKGLRIMYEKKAINIVNDWSNEIKNNDFYIYRNRDKEKYNESRIKEVNLITPIKIKGRGVDALYDILKSINKTFYPLSLDEYTVKNDLYKTSGLKKVIEAGINKEIKGALNTSIAKRKLENCFEGALNVDNYWELMPNIKISKIKIDIDNFIKKAIKNNGRVSMADIYDKLKKGKYGFIVNKKTAFIVGFLLKEYATDTYKYSDDTVSSSMTVEKLSEIIEEELTHTITPKGKYVEKYIMSLTREEKIFANVTSKIFNVDEDCCSSYERGRDEIRKRVKDLVYPLWSLGYLEEVQEDTEKANIIKLYSGILNSGDSNNGKSEFGYAVELVKYIETIGEDRVIAKFENVINESNTSKGIMKFIEEYKNGILKKLSDEILDDGQYLNILKEKIKEKNVWVWEKGTLEVIIDGIILDYEIIAKSKNHGINKQNIEDVFNGWCEVTKYIKISSEVLKEEKLGCDNILDSLVKILKDDRTIELRTLFLESLTNEGIAFKNLLEHRENKFKIIFKEMLTELTDDEIKKIFNNIDSNAFRLNKTLYIDDINRKINVLKESSVKVKLQNMWEKATNAKTPYEWSSKNLMPIIAMVDTDEEIQANRVFRTINSGSCTIDEITNAIEFLETSNLLTYINNKEVQDEKFIEKIIKDKKNIIDIEETKKLLLNKVSDVEPHEWSNSTKVEDEIKKYAKIIYNTKKVNEVISEIDTISEGKLRGYIKKLATDNMEIGLVILNM